LLRDDEPRARIRQRVIPPAWTDVWICLHPHGHLQATGGGTRYDLGVYCINAARYLFQAEPVEVVARSANSGELRFTEVDEMTSALVRLPGERLASFTTSFGVPEVGCYQVVGTRGNQRVDPRVGADALLDAGGDDAQEELCQARPVRWTPKMGR